MVIYIGNNLHLEILRTFYFFILYYSRKSGEKSKTFFDLKIREEYNMPPLYIFEKKKKITEKKEKKVTKKEESQDQGSGGSKLLVKDKKKYLDLDDSNFDFNLFSKYNNLFSDFNLIGNKNNNDYDYDHNNNNNNSNSNNNDSKNNNNYHNENENKNNEMIVYDQNEQKNNNAQSTWWFDKYSET